MKITKNLLLNKMLKMQICNKAAKNVALGISAVVVTKPIVSNLKSSDSFEKVPMSELASIEESLPEINLDEKVDILKLVTNGEIDAEGIEELLPQLDIGVGEVVYGSSFLLKMGEPIKDLKNGETEKGIIKAVVRGVDTLLLPVKCGWAGVKAVKGAVLSLKGIESEKAGIIGGFKDGLKGWGRNRKIIERSIIEEGYKYTEPEVEYRKYALKKKNLVSMWQEKLAERSKGSSEKLQAWIDGNINEHSRSNDYFATIIRAERRRAKFYKNQINNICFDKEIDTETIKEDLALLQKEKFDLKKYYAQYKQKFNAAFEKLKNDDGAIKKIKTLKKALGALYVAKQEVIDAEISKVNNLLKIYNIFKHNHDRQGLSRIAGYDDIKQLLDKKYLTPLKQKIQGKNVAMPNMLLLYGHKGCGKTLFANSIEQETKSKIIRIETNMDSEEDVENLKSAIQAAKKNYNENKTSSTIIRIEEVDAFLNNVALSEDILSEINGLSDYNTIIIATTNHPREINKQFIPKKGFMEILIPPANKKNIQEILKYYTTEFSDDSVNFEALTNHILDMANGGAYSNARLIKSLEKGIKELFIMNGKLTQQDYVEIINKIHPDIKNKDLKYYQTKGK